jgi:hypothetical protein
VRCSAAFRVRIEGESGEESERASERVNEGERERERGARGIAGKRSARDSAGGRGSVIDYGERAGAGSNTGFGGPVEARPALDWGGAGAGAVDGE